MLELHPEDLKKQWLHRRVGSRNSNKGGYLRPSFSSNCLFVSFSIPSLLPFSILSLLPFLISTSLSTIPSCFLINCLSQDKHFIFHSVSLFSQASLARGSCALPSVLFLLGMAIGSKKTFGIHSYIVRVWTLHRKKPPALLLNHFNILSYAHTILCSRSTHAPESIGKKPITDDCR